MVKVLFVCMGNICRSPTAEAVFRQRVERAGLKKQIKIDSAGTHSYHVGGKPDARAQQAADNRGFDLSRLRARQVRVKDFGEFDYILAMDSDNLGHLQADCPEEYADKVRLFLDYRQNHQEQDVPDPYYGGRKGFEYVLDLVEDAADGLLAEIVVKFGFNIK
jgi:protein-tyrosine phosphatase